MKKYFSILLFAITACSPQLSEEATPVNDSSVTINSPAVSLQHELLIAKQELDSAIRVIDTITREKSEIVRQLYEKRAIILQLLSESIKYKQDNISLMIVARNFESVKKDNSHYLYQLDSSAKANKTLKTLLKTESIKSTSYRAEREFYRQKNSEASRLIPAGITATAYGVNWITKKEFETDRASKVKRIIISMILPENKLFTPKSYCIKVRLHGLPKTLDIQDSVIVHYNGTEQFCSFPLAQELEYKTGEHKFDIFINNELVYNGSINLK